MSTVQSYFIPGQHYFYILLLSFGLGLKRGILKLISNPTSIKRDNYFNISKVYEKRIPPNLPFRKGEELKTPSLFEKGGLGWVKKNYWFITAGLIISNSEVKLK